MRKRSTAIVVDLARGFALFFGAFGTANVSLGLYRPDLDANEFWIGLPNFAVAPACLALIGWSVAPRIRFARHTAALASLTLAARCIEDAFGVAQAERAGTVVVGSALSFSTGLATCFVVLGVTALRSRFDRVATRSWRRQGTVLASAGACAALFPLALSWTLGRSDYRGRADAIVVFGARAYADGTLSHALEDRVRTAADLYRAGCAQQIWMSGGPGDGAVHEVEAMRNAAIGLGVRSDDIALDFEGWNTAKTARNLALRLPQNGRVIAVSHGFHLARVRLAFARLGLDVVTVPADSVERPLAANTRLHLRDAVGFWAYWAGYGS